MHQVESPRVDIILDPYALNVLPQSLTITVAYVLIVAAMALVLSQHILAWITTMGGRVSESRMKTKKDT